VHAQNGNAAVRADMKFLLEVFAGVTTDSTLSFSADTSFYLNRREAASL